MACLPLLECIWKHARQKTVLMFPAPRKISLKRQIIDFMLLQRFVNEGAPADEFISSVGRVGARPARQPDRGCLSAAARRHHQRCTDANGETTYRASAPA